MKKWETLKKNVALLLTAAVLIASCTPMAYGTVTAAEETPPAADEVADIQIHATVDTKTGQGSNGFSIDPATAFGSAYNEANTKWISSGTNAAYQCADGTTPAIYTNISGASAKFTPTILKAGYYEVYYWALQGMNTNGTVTSSGVDNQDFETQPKAVASGNGIWQRVGAYQFAQTDDTNKDSQFVQVKKGSASTGNFRATSVKFVYVGETKPETIEIHAKQGGGDGFTLSSHTWSTSSYLSANGQASLYSTAVGAYCQYTPTIQTAGNYDVYYWAVQGLDSTTGTVTSGDKTDQAFTTPLTSATSGNESYQKVGTYYFDATTASNKDAQFVKMTQKNNSGTLRATSVKFVYAGGEEPTPTPTITPTASPSPVVYEVKIENAAGTVTGAGEYEYGEKATVTAKANEDYTFAYWQEGDKIVSYDPSYTFTVTGDTELIAQFKPVTAGNTCKVVFKDINGVVLGTIDNVTKDSKLTDDQINAVQVPSKPGRTFERWDKDLTQTTVTQDTIVTAVYTKTSDTYTVSIDGTVHNTLPFDTKVTVTADAQKDGQSFSYWQEIGGKIVSYNPSYSFYVAKNINLTAVYGQTVVYAPVVTTMNPIIDSANQKMSFISQIVLPSGYEMIECGTLIYNQAGEFDLETTGVKKVKARTQTEAGQYMATLTGIPSNSTRYARGYLVYQITGESSVTAVYGDIVNGTLE